MSSSSSHVQLLALVLIKSNARRLAQLPALTPHHPSPGCPSLSLPFRSWAFSLSLLLSPAVGCGTAISIRSFAILVLPFFYFRTRCGSRGYLFDSFGRQPSNQPAAGWGGRQELRTEPSSTELRPVSFGQITAGGCSVAGIDCCSKLKTVPELCVQPAEMESERRQQQWQGQPRLGPQV